MPVRGENSLYFATGLDNSGLATGAQDALGIVSNLGASIARINPFLALTAGAATAFATIANSAFKLMRDFEQSMAEVKTIAGLTEEEFAKLEKRVFKLSQTLGTETPAALGKGLYDIIGAGYEAADALQLLEIASKAATAGVTTSAVAADGLTTILNAFQLQASDAAEVADVMFATVDRGKISFEQLSTQIAQVAPLAAASGFSFQEIGGAIATLTKQGVPASQAMTQIQSAIIATNEVMGDGVAASMTLQNAFQVMYEKAGGSQNKLKDLAGRIEAVNGILAIAGPNFKGATEDLEAMGEAAGSVDKNFKIIASTNVNEWTILGNRIKATTADIGTAVLQVSSGIARFLNTAIKDGNDLEKSFEAQRLELIKLENTLRDTTEGSEEWDAIRDQILSSFPDHISGITNETATTENLLGVLNRVNESYRERYKLQVRANELQQKEDVVANIEIKSEDIELKFDRTIDRLKLIAEKQGIELNIGYSSTISEVEKELGRIKNAFSQQIGEGKNKITLPGVADRDFSLLKQYSQALQDIESDLNKAQADRNETAANNRKIAQQDLKDLDKRAAAIKLIGKAMKEEDFANYTGSGIAEVDQAIEARREIVDQFTSINQAENIESLKPFLDHELEEIKAYAQKKYRLLNTTAPGGGGGPGDLPDPEAYAKSLKERQRQYETFQAVVSQIGEEAAREQFASLLAMGESYGEFLKNQLSQTKDFAKQQAIAVAATAAGLDLKGRPQATSVGGLTAQPVILDFQVDGTSIAFIEKTLEELREKWRNASEADRAAFEEPIRIWQARLDAATNGKEAEEDLYADLRRSLSDLTNQQLREYRDYWRQKVETAKRGSAEERDAISKVESAEKQIGENTADTISQIGTSLGHASEMFRKFGDEDVAEALAQLELVAQSFASIAVNVASGNYLGAIVSVLGMVAGALSGKSSKKSEFQIAMEGLDESVKKLAKSLDRVYGAEAIANRNQMLRDLAAQKDLLETQIEALQRLADNEPLTMIRNQYLEQIRVWREQLEEINDSIYEAGDEFQEFLTGTTRDNIADSIIQGFRDGKRGIEDFAETFEEMMQDAMLAAFKNNFLQQRLEEFYNQFSDMSEDGLSNADLRGLQDLFNAIVEGAAEEMDALNAILESAGLGGVGQEARDNREGLSGAITNITEDTANVLAGYLNAIRLDMRQGLEVNTQSLAHLQEIAANTRYNRFLESIDSRMATVERGILAFEAQG